MCGSRGPLACGKCKLAHYCGAAHQKIDWSLGEHKKVCGTDSFDVKKSIGNPKHEVLFEEFELVTDPEEQSDTPDGETDEQAEERRLKDYEKFLAEQKAKATDDDLKDVSDEEFNKYTSQIDEDVVFGKFKKRIQLDEEQVSSVKAGKSSRRCSHEYFLQISCRFYASIAKENHFGSPIRIV